MSEDIYGNWEAEKHIEWRAKCLNLEAALEVERQKKDYFNQDNQRLKAELERACDKLEVERGKVRELEAKVSFTHGLERLRDDLARQLKEAKTEVVELKAQLAQAHAALRVQHCPMCHAYLGATGWLSPDEAKALQAQCAALQELIQHTAKRMREYGMTTNEIDTMLRKVV